MPYSLPDTHFTTEHFVRGNCAERFFVFKLCHKTEICSEKGILWKKITHDMNVPDSVFVDFVHEQLWLMQHGLRPLADLSAVLYIGNSSE